MGVDQSTEERGISMDPRKINEMFQFPTGLNLERRLYSAISLCEYSILSPDDPYLPLVKSQIDSYEFESLQLDKSFGFIPFRFRESS